MEYSYVPVNFGSLNLAKERSQKVALLLKVQSQVTYGHHCRPRSSLSWWKLAWMEAVEDCALFSPVASHSWRPAPLPGRGRAPAEVCWSPGPSSAKAGGCVSALCSRHFRRVRSLIKHELMLAAGFPDLSPSQDSADSDLSGLRQQAGLCFHTNKSLL